MSKTEAGIWAREEVVTTKTVQGIPERSFVSPRNNRRSLKRVSRIIAPSTRYEYAHSINSLTYLRTNAYIYICNDILPLYYALYLLPHVKDSSFRGLRNSISEFLFAACLPPYRNRRTRWQKNWTCDLGKWKFGFKIEEPGVFSGASSRLTCMQSCNSSRNYESWCSQSP